TAATPLAPTGDPRADSLAAAVADLQRRLDALQATRCAGAAPAATPSDSGRPRGCRASPPARRVRGRANQW
ncbi:MAG TPA: hypothetical protein VFT84_06795, partial [Gemmatimonadales bacterium]|nr:hypothetical protein [Gemmatimonadales bacterium]